MHYLVLPTAIIDELLSTGIPSMNNSESEEDANEEVRSSIESVGTAETTRGAKGLVQTYQFCGRIHEAPEGMSSTGSSMGRLNDHSKFSILNSSASSKM